MLTKPMGSSAQQIERGTAARRVHDYMRARFGRFKSPAKEMERRYGWRDSKASKIFTGEYVHVTADDIYLIIEIDGAGAAVRLFDLGGPGLGGAGVMDHLCTALAALQSAQALLPEPSAQG